MSDAVADAIAALPGTPVGRQAAWYLACVHARGAAARAADYERFGEALLEEIGRPADDAAAEAGWSWVSDRLGAFRALTFEPASENELVVALEAAPDRHWRIGFAVEPQPPHRLARVQWDRQRDFTLEVREAQPADWPLLCEIERQAPIVRGEARLFFDRGEHWFDFTRLVEDATVGLALVDGAPAAVTCGTRHTVRIGGADKDIVTVSHLRVLPEHQRKGLWGEVNRVLDKDFREVEGSNAFIAVANAAMQHGFRNTPDKWPVPFEWGRLDTRALAGPPAGRAATRADADDLAELLNRFRAGEEMFVPYDAASLAARLERAPDLYGWDRLWLADGAAVGVWPAGRAQRLVTEEAGERRLSEPGVVLDYAFAPGAEAAFEALVRAWCAWLAERGMDSLSIFTSPGSRGYAAVRRLAPEMEPFNMWTPRIPVPPGATERGLYIDPLYF